MIQLVTFNGLVMIGLRGKIHVKPHECMGKSMVSCRFSCKPIHCHLGDPLPLDDEELQWRGPSAQGRKTANPDEIPPVSQT
jgi:hypothetical protein